jgi:hypothetical protein
MVKIPALQPGGGATKKLLHLWEGPYAVRARIGHTTYMVEDASGGERSVNVRRMKRYYVTEHAEADPGELPTLQKLARQRQARATGLGSLRKQSGRKGMN